MKFKNKLRMACESKYLAPNSPTVVFNIFAYGYRSFGKIFISECTINFFSNPFAHVRRNL